jgi:SAM-dependent methyltransferase
MTADVAFYVEVARKTREADGPVVELAVGNGRVAIPVALAIGRPVIGIDSSPALLAQARVRAAEAGVHLDLREGDMRELRLDEPAARNLAGTTSWGRHGAFVTETTRDHAGARDRIRGATGGDAGTGVGAEFWRPARRGESTIGIWKLGLRVILKRTSV